MNRLTDVCVSSAIGARPPHNFVPTAQTGPNEIQVLHERYQRTDPIITWYVHLYISVLSISNPRPCPVDLDIVPSSLSSPSIRAAIVAPCHVSTGIDSMFKLKIVNVSNSWITGKAVLVPLTSSLYVPGKLSNVLEVVVDVGTGYYIKKVGPDRLDLVWSVPISLFLPFTWFFDT